MYDVIKYIWTLDEFKTKFSRLAEQAEAELESENPPLFLRFINLLVNDAIFLLDEGLNYMKTIQVSIYTYKVMISLCMSDHNSWTPQILIMELGITTGMFIVWF